MNSPAPLSIAELAKLSGHHFVRLVPDPGDGDRVVEFRCMCGWSEDVNLPRDAATARRAAVHLSGAL